VRRSIFQSPLIFKWQALVTHLTKKDNRKKLKTEKPLSSPELKKLLFLWYKLVLYNISAEICIRKLRILPLHLQTLKYRQSSDGFKNRFRSCVATRRSPFSTNYLSLWIKNLKDPFQLLTNNPILILSLPDLTKSCSSSFL